MEARNKKLLGLGLSLLFLGIVSFAQSEAPPPPHHAPMEMFGVGPEMFADRGSAWVEAIGNVLEKAIAKLGGLALAIIVVIQNIKQKASLQEVKDHVDQRLDTQAKRINDVALAVPPVPGTTTSIESPEKVEIQT